MSLFAWFKDLKEKSPFNTFQKKIERLKALLFVMDEEIEKEHFQQLKGHLHATILIIGSKDSLDNTCLVRLINYISLIALAIKKPAKDINKKTKEMKIIVKRYFISFLIFHDAYKSMIK